MKKLMILLCTALGWCAVQAQTPVLRFNKEGKIKIAQFTDVHLDLSTPVRCAEAEKTIAQMYYIFDTEHPDFVMFTGDVVTGAPAADGWHRVLAAVAKYRLPFCVVLGNHDAEQDISRERIAQIVTSYPTSLNTRKSGELDDLVIEVKGPASAPDRTEALFYCLDSHADSPIEGIGDYAWFTPEQVLWYRNRSAEYTAGNGGKPLPALAFFHIALPEYVAAWRNPDNTHIGRAAEDECPGALNSGMFAAMRESGDVMGMFVGHDHDIDYVVSEKGIALGYGRFSGDNTTYNNLRSGVRLLVLTRGERGFETWIHERDGRIVDHVFFRGGKVSKELK